LKNRMLKIILVAAMSFLLSTYAYASGGIDISYDVSSRTIFFKGSSDAGYVNISILPRKCMSNPDECVLTHSHSILTTEKSKGGSLNVSFTLGDAPSFEDGCYVAAVQVGDKSYKRYFSIAAANGMNSTLLDLGLDTSYESEILTQRAAFKTENINEFSDMSVLSEGIVLMKKGVISADEFISCYSGIGGSSSVLYEYNLLENGLKNSVNELIKKQSFKKSMSETFADALILAKVNVNKEKAAGDVISYLNSTGESLTDYNSLSTYYKEKVLGEITAVVYSDIETLISNFKNSVKTQLALMNNAVNTPPSGGGGSGGGSGGRGSSGGYTISDKPKDEKKEKELRFSDIASHWAKEDIIMVAGMGAITGYTDGSFKPDNKITRAEFVKILSGMLSLPDGSGEKFSDVPSDKWFFPYVYAASSYGIINGISEDRFGPDEMITREDASVIIYRALSKKGVSFSANLAFNDNKQISDYAKEAVANLSGGEIIKGSGGLFRPKDTLSRAETVAMLRRISGYIK